MRRRLQRTWRQLYDLRVPILCTSRGRVRGVDLAAFTLADYRIAAADASFDYRGSHCRWLLPHMLNASDLAALGADGGVVPASRARLSGLVAELCNDSPGTIEKRAVRFASWLSHHSALGQQGMLRPRAPAGGAAKAMAAAKAATAAPPRRRRRWCGDVVRGRDDAASAARRETGAAARRCTGWGRRRRCPRRWSGSWRAPSESTTASSVTCRVLGSMPRRRRRATGTARRRSSSARSSARLRAPSRRHGCCTHARRAARRRPPTPTNGRHRLRRGPRRAATRAARRGDPPRRGVPATA